jgi:hypothetical protein
LTEDLAGRLAVEDVRGVHTNNQKTTHCIHNNISLPALHKLTTIEAGLDRRLGRPFDALTINHGAAWIRISALFLAQTRTQGRIELLQESAVRPLVVVSSSIY